MRYRWLETVSSLIRFSFDDYARPVFGVPPDELFNKLYVERGDEERLLQALRDAADIVFVGGHQGEGKSSLLQYVLPRLPKGTAHLTVDLREHMHALGFLPSEDYNGFIRELDQIVRYELACQFLTDAKVYERVLLDMLRRFFMLEFMDLTLEYQAREGCDLEAGAVQELASRDPERLHKIASFIRGRATLPQYIRSLRDVLFLTGFVVVFENVDALPQWEQCALVTYSIDFHSECVGSVGLVLPVRLRNIVRFQSGPLQMSEPVGGEIVHLVGLGGNDTHARLQEITHMNPDLSWDVVKRRLEFAVERTRAAAEAGADRLARATELLRLSFPTHSMLALANYSTRLLLAWVASYVSETVQEDTDETKEVLLCGEWGAVSHWLRWLSKTEVYRHALPDVVEEYSSAPLGSTTVSRFQICQAVVGWLSRQAHPPVVSDVLAAMQHIGLEEHVVGQVLAYLSVESAPECRHIELIDARGDRRTGDDIHPACRVVLNPLGREFFLAVAWKFEYLSLLVAKHLGVTHPEGETSPFPSASDVERMLAFTRIVAERELEFLRLAVAALGRVERGPGLLQHYLTNYCHARQTFLDRVAVGHKQYLGVLSKSEGLDSRARSVYADAQSAYGQVQKSFWKAAKLP